MRPPSQGTYVRLNEFSFDLDSGEESPQLHLEFVDPAPLPIEVLQRKQEQEHVQRFIRSLSATDQDVVRRHYWDEQPQADIARALAVSEAAISKRLKKVLSVARDSLVHLKLAN